jgi:hypothetical protein
VFTLVCWPTVLRWRSMIHAARATGILPGCMGSGALQAAQAFAPGHVIELANTSTMCSLLAAAIFDLHRGCDHTSFVGTYVRWRTRAEAPTCTLLTLRFPITFDRLGYTLAWAPASTDGKVVAALDR